ncbi:MAG: ion transporter [Phycisphaerales bacterium JB040]
MRERLYHVIFEAETPAGRAFDIALLGVILLSIIAVMLESVREIAEGYGVWLRGAEWVFTGLFTLEYIVRIATVRRPWRYVFSFFGLVDLLSILPTYLSLLLPGTQSLLVIRSLRLVRVFRVFKLARYVGEGQLLIDAVKSSRQKITVFLVVIVTVVMIIGSAMYLVEGPEHGFTNIPQGVYWAVVTMTTVGYGDISPQTPLGKLLASGIMIMGYGIIAVPTGIVTAEVIEAQQRRNRRALTRVCKECHAEGHDLDASYCKRCGAAL